MDDVDWVNPKNGEGKRRPWRESRNLGLPCASNSTTLNKMDEENSLEEENLIKVNDVDWVPPISPQGNITIGNKKNPRKRKIYS